MNTLSDQAYFDGLCRKDDKVINQIYQSFSRSVIDYIRKNSGTTDDARDILQEGLLVIYQNYCGRNPDTQKSFGGLLSRICKNLWLSRLREIKKDEHLRIIEENRYSNEEQEGDPPAGMETADLRDISDKCWETTFLQLSDLCRKLLYLKYVDESSGEEMTAASGLNSPNTVYQRIFDCRQRWRKLYSEQCKG